MEPGRDRPLTALIARIRASSNSLSRAERRVADAVLGDPTGTVYASVTELAEVAGVGETTVLRFARRLGYRSYQAFKIDLARDLSQVDTETPKGEAREEDGLLWRLTERNQNVILETYRLLDHSALDSVVSILSESTGIHFFGVGHSGITADDGAYRFMRLGFPARSYGDPHFQVMAASALGASDAAVGLSISGSTKDTVEALRIAQERGARTIAITGYARSPLTHHADVSLLVAGRESPLESGSFTSKMGQLHLLDLILLELVRRNETRVEQHRENVGRAISEKLY